MYSVKRVEVFAKRCLKEILRDRLSLIFLFLFPIILLVLFYSIFHSFISQFEIIYLAPSMISFSHVFLSLFVAIIIANDKESLFITRLYTTPLKSYEFILGYFLSVIPIGLIQTCIILIISVILNPNFFSWNILLCIPFSIVSIGF